MTLQEKLYSLRRKAGYSQEELAEKLGVSRQAVSKWERGESSPDINNVIAITQLYDVSVDELVSCIRGDNSVLYGSRKSSGISLKKPESTVNSAEVQYENSAENAPDDGEIYPDPRPQTAAEAYPQQENTFQSEVKTAENIGTYTQTYANNPPAVQSKKGFFGRKSSTGTYSGISPETAELCKKLKKFPFWALAITVFLASLGILNYASYLSYVGYVAVPAVVCGLSIPLYYSIVRAIEKNDPIHFGYPFFAGIMAMFSLPHIYRDAEIAAMIVFWALSVPLYYTAAAAYKHKKMKYFCFPVLVAMIYVIGAILLGESAAVGLLWTFGLIPFYYIYSSKLDKLFFGPKSAKKGKRGFFRRK